MTNGVELAVSSAGEKRKGDLLGSETGRPKELALKAHTRKAWSLSEPQSLAGGKEGGKGEECLFRLVD